MLVGSHDPGDRWRLHRAGILNVYQYGDETIDMAGGRLLLRGVNGSGKSTAMNMLLPFLVEADARRIDAAGEQTGVLRSWMLSGRDEANPIGYLWLELIREPHEDGAGAAYLSFGCGIRASAATERVTTWWFITEKRPGLDFSLLDRRTPLTADALRAAIGSHAVYAQDRRPDYRRELRNRLYAGADIDNHLRLLHTVRSPRVGDRIDTDLPAYLLDALPQLSEAALEDAAAPLQDLDEHRGNVAALTVTARELEGLAEVYRQYGRAQLRDLAANTTRLHREVRDARRLAEEARRHAGDAVAAYRAILDAVDRYAAEERQLDAALGALRDRPEYREGMELTNLRTLVERLYAEVARLEEQARRLASRESDAATRVAQMCAGYDADLDKAREELDGIAVDAARWHLGSLPPIQPAPRRTESGGRGEEVPIPADPSMDGSAGLRAAIASLIARADVRRQEIREIVALIDAADRLERALQDEERERRRRHDDARRAEDAYATARRRRLECETAWRDQSLAWLAALGELDVTSRTDPQQLGDLLDNPDVLDRLHDIRATMLNAVELAIDRHRGRLADEMAALPLHLIERDRCRAQRDELARTTLPAPPSTPWQRTARGTVLSEMLDFRPALDLAAQLGIEAALEAAGILAAELAPAHSSSATGPVLALETGELVALATAPVTRPLSDLLIVAEGVPDDQASQVRAVLDGISIDPSGDASTVITADGQFRVGPLRGRHAKLSVEHIGLAARRAALERQRAAAELALATAEELVDATRTRVAHSEQQIAELSAHRRNLPPTEPVTTAAAQADAAEQTLAGARDAVERAAEAVRRAEADHAAAVAEGRRIATSRQLPFERDELGSGDRALLTVQGNSRTAVKVFDTLERSLRAWMAAADQWRDLRQDGLERVEHLRAKTAERDEHAARLATLEDTIGLKFQEIADLIRRTEADRDRARSDRNGAEQSAREAAKEEARTGEAAQTAAARVVTAEQSCARTLPRLMAALQVRGLVEAAVSVAQGSATTHEAIPAWPSVDDSADGARELAVAVERAIVAAERPVAADGVRLSLRQRRDQLGAGWDAEDYQPDPNLPLAVEVTGPLGRMPLADAAAEVSAQLRQQESLLTAKQDQALRNLLQGVVAKELAQKMFEANELVRGMNDRLATVKTAHGVGASLRWRRRDDLDPELSGMIALLAKSPDLREPEEDRRLTTALSERLERARRDEPDAVYRDLIASVLDYRTWHEMSVLVSRPGESARQLARHPRLSEGEKKIVSYLPLFAAVAASYDALGELAPWAPRFVLLDDAFAKVSEDNHGSLFGLLVSLDLDFIVTSERLWGTHASVPELSICEVVRDAELKTIVLERALWTGSTLERA